MNARHAVGIVCGLLCAVFAAAAVAQTAREGRLPEEITDLIERGNAEEARRALRAYRRAHPDDPRALVELGRLEEDRNLARALLKEAERYADPDLAFEAAYLRAETLYTEGDLTGAEEILAGIVKDRPDAPLALDAVYRLGMIRLFRGDPDNALLQFRKVRDASPDPFKKSLARAGILECHVARRDWNRVLVAAREVLEGRDDVGALTPRVLETLALAWRELGNEENAEKFTNRILTDFPRSYQAFVLRAEGEKASDAPPPVGKTGGLFPGVPGKGALDSGNGRAGVPADSLPGEKTEFTVQAGAYEQRQNALALHDRLRIAGYPVRIEVKTVGDKHRYLVRIGVYSTREEAERVAERIVRELGVRGNVVFVR